METCLPHYVRGDHSLFHQHIFQRVPQILKSNIPFDRICEDLLDATLKGFAVSEVVWLRDDDLIRPRMVKSQDQRRFVFDEDWQPRLLTWTDMREGIQLPARKFITHRFGVKGNNPYGLGLGSRLFWAVLFKREGVAFWLHFLEKFAGPTIVGKTPYGTLPDEQRKLINTLIEAKTSSAITVPIGTDIDFLEASRSGTVSYEQWLAYWDRQISICVTGETLTTQVGESGGNRALGEVHQEMLDLLVDSDADLLSDTLRETLIRWLVEYNCPGAELPSVWRVRPKNEKAAAETRQIKAGAAEATDKAIRAIVKAAASFEDDAVAREYIVSFEITDLLSDRTIDALVEARHSFVGQPYPSTATPDPNFDNNRDSADYAVLARTDVTVQKTASHLDGAEVQAGQELIYILTAQGPETGLSGADDVTVTDRLPPGLRIAGVNPIGTGTTCEEPTGLDANGITTTGSALVCRFGRLGHDISRTVEVSVVPTTAIAGSTIPNNVEITTSTDEIDTTNNSDTISHVIGRPSLDLVTNKTDSADPMEVGTETVYTITVRNVGPSEAFNVEIRDILPDEGMVYRGFNADTGMACRLEAGAATDTIGGEVVCDVPHLGVGETAELQITMRADQRGPYTNRVEVRSDEYADEPNKGNNDVAETTTVFERSNLSVTKEASKSPVDLGEVFDWQITVVNTTDTGIGLAEDVVLRDSLPGNMVIAGAVGTSSTSGTGASCDAPMGGRDLICIVDDMEAGHDLTVTLPVRVTSVAANPEDASNSATVETASFDETPGDNSSTGIVSVRSTSVSGSIWRDFNENESRDGPASPGGWHDSGIANLTVELTGNNADGQPDSWTTTTDADGNYSFDLLPPGDYRVSFTPPAGDRYVTDAGSALPGDGGGTAEGDRAIANITATTDNPAPRNDFTLVPEARIALAKTASAANRQDDGSYELLYQFRVRNDSQEPLLNMTLTDDLQTGFGEYLADGTPEPGQFTVVRVGGSDSGSTVELDSGSDDQLVISWTGRMAPGQTWVWEMVLRVNPVLPRNVDVLDLHNHAEVTSTGELSNKEVSDPSNNGTTPTHGLSSPTQRSITFRPAIRIDKEAVPASAGTTAQPGDRIDYVFTVTNSGNTPLLDIEIEDLLPGLVWDDEDIIARLDPGEEDSTSFAAHYILTQDDIESGRVENTATATGIWAEDGVPGGPTVSDEDTALVEALAEPSLTVEKVADVSAIQDPTQPGDTITYGFTVTNTGNVEIHNLVLTDAMLGLEGAEAITIDTLVPAGEAGETSFTTQRSYTVTQDDIDAGEVVNTAIANGTHGPDDTPIEEPSNPVTTELFPDPEMRVTKLLDGAAPTEPQAGDEITWTITIENTGNTTLENIDIAEQLPGASVGAASPSTIAPGGEAIATATYVLTQEDIDAGEVLNQVTVSGNVPGSDIPFDDTPSGNDPDTPNEDETNTPLPAVPSIALLKELTSDVGDPLMPGDQISFNFTIHNSGNVTLSNIVLTDDLPEVDLDLSPLAGLSLAPDAEIEVTGTYEVTAEDIANGGLENTATVTADDPHGTPVEDDSGTGFDSDDPTVVNLLRDPQIALVKTISTAPTAPVQAGDVIEYAFAIHNTGNVELRDITLTDLVGGVDVSGSRNAPLPVGGMDDTSFTGQYTLTQADIDAGSFANEARVDGVGDGPDGSEQPVSDRSGTGLDNDDPTVLDIDPHPALSIVKTEDVSGVQDPARPGDVITYAFAVENTGNVTLTDVTVTDPLPGLAFDSDINVIASLAPGETGEVTASYALEQGDIDAGEVVNMASATGVYDDSGTPVTTPPEDSNEVTVPLNQLPQIALEKRVTSTLSADPQAGEEVTYGFTVTNTGNVELTDVTVAELLIGATVSGGPITLAPGQSDETSFTATYELTQDDIEAGLLENQTQATGTDAISGDPVTDQAEADLTIPHLPGIELTKTGSISGFADPDQPVAGDQIRYGFVVENTGNVILRDIVLSDAGLVFDAGGPAPFDLAPGETRELEDIGGHVLTQADLDAGSYENTATVTGDWGEDDPQPISDDDTEITSLIPAPAIDLVKLIDSDNSQLSSPVQEGDVIHYAFTVTNTGNVTLTGITIDDPMPGLDLTGSLDRLEPGMSDSAAFSATYVLTQADINRGDVVNQAEVTGIWGEDGGVPQVVTDISGTGTGMDDETVFDMDRESGLSVVKSADDSGLQTPPQPGDIIDYSFVITNTGNVTLTDVTLTDPLPLDLPVTVIDVLEPGAGNAVTLTGSYAITQADIEQGLVENTAEVSGTFTDPDTGDTETPSSPSNRVEVPLEQLPQLAVVKSAQPALTDPAEPGQQITYEFRVINTGNVRLENVVLTEPLPGISPDEFDLGDMEPGAELTATATYAITQADIDAGRVVNQATATGTFDGTPVTDLSGPDPETDEETVVPVSQDPGLALVKSADAAALSDPAVVGQEIVYSFTVTNTGNVVLRDLVISDPLTGLEPGRFELAELVPGQDVTVGPARYAITQADINAGAVENRALASGEYGPPDDPGSIETPSTNDEGVDGPTVTPVAGHPAIALVKALDPTIDAASLGLGDQIRWVFTVTNTGNVPLADVRVTEEMVDATVSGGPISLDVGESDSDSFAASYVITQADLDAGRIVNSALATGSFDDGSGTPRVVEDISGGTIDDDEPVTTDLGQRAEIDLVKQADLSGLSSPPQEGDEVPFSFVITNTGEITLTDVTLTDPMEGLELTGAPIGRLAPGAVDRTSYRAVYRLTQADIDAGAPLENQAVVTGDYSDPSGDPQQVTDLSGTETGTDGPTLVPLERITGLELEKTADTSELGEVAQEGDRITYCFAITNTGNVTLNDVTVDDPLPGLELSGAPIASLAPGETSMAITGTYVLTIEDIQAAERDNTATAHGEWRPGDGQPATPVESDPSTVNVPLGYPEVELEITIGDLRDLNGDGVMGPDDEVLFLFEVVNTGTVPLRDVNLDMDSLSLSMPGLSCAPVSLEVGARAFLECTGNAYRITQADAADGQIRLTGDATGTSDAGVTVRASSQAATVANLSRGGLALEKLAGVETAMIGDLVPYTIRITNAADGVEVTARLEDTLPPGFGFSAGSARLDGAEVALEDSGRRIWLDPVTVQPGQTRVLTLQARVGSAVQPGAHVNRVRLLSRTTGADIAPEATATVRVLADAVMQCATVLGRVFDDVDQNGHMSQSSEERGLPNVRLIAPNGLAINTDEHGRFNVPCAALPQAVGSNFMLKLDERTLPAGYRVTTENPRVVRLTPGMITRLDFGATMARLVRVDLAANAFDGADMGAPLQAGLRQLVGEIHDTVAMLRITYLLAPGEGEDSARHRLRMVERSLRDLWRGEGKYKLNIETLIQRAGEAQ